MIDIIEVCKRCDIGPIVKEEDFDLKYVFPKMREIVKKYNIKCNPEEPVPDKDDLADRVFQAAVDFFVEVGAYCKDTSRIIKFSRDEVIKKITEGPHECKGGEGDDEKIWKTRKPDEDSFPWGYVGSGIYSSTDEFAMHIVEAYGSIKNANCIAIPTLGEFKGNRILPKHPLEIKGVFRTSHIAKKALKNVSRPGLAIFNYMPTSASTQATIAACHPISGVRPSDGWLIPVLAEMKVGYDSLSKVAMLQELNTNYAVASSAMFGGYVGGVEGVAIASVAYVFLSALIFDTNYHCNFPITLKESISSTRQMLWAVSVASQAVSRNTSMPFFNIGYMANGPSTENYFYEAAAYIISSVSSGVTCQTPFPSKGVMKDGMTPMEVRFYSELIELAPKIKRNKANGIVNKLLEKYEEKLYKPERGRSYPECFDTKTNTPDDEYLKLYDKVKTELINIGINMK